MYWLCTYCTRAQIDSDVWLHVQKIKKKRVDRNETQYILYRFQKCIFSHLKNKKNKWNKELLWIRCGTHIHVVYTRTLVSSTNRRMLDDCDEQHLPPPCWTFGQSKQTERERAYAAKSKTSTTTTTKIHQRGIGFGLDWIRLYALARCSCMWCVYTTSTRSATYARYIQLCVCGVHRVSRAAMYASIGSCGYCVYVSVANGADAADFRTEFMHTDCVLLL